MIQNQTEYFYFSIFFLRSIREADTVECNLVTKHVLCSLHIIIDPVIHISVFFIQTLCNGMSTIAIESQTVWPSPKHVTDRIVR